MSFLSGTSEERGNKMVEVVKWHVMRPYPGAAVTTSVGLFKENGEPGGDIDIKFICNNVTIDSLFNDVSIIGVRGIQHDAYLIETKASCNGHYAVEKLTQWYNTVIGFIKLELIPVVPTKIPLRRAFVFVYDGEQMETIETMFREIAKLDASAELKLDKHYLYIVHYNKVAAKLYDDTAKIIAQKDAEIAYLKAQLAQERASRSSSSKLQKRKRNHRK